MKLGDFDYDLPRELIAQTPAETRDGSRLMIVDRSSQEIKHDYFYNLPKYLRPDDLLVFNDTKVFPARLYGRKESGGKVEILLLSNAPSDPPLNLRGGRQGELLKGVWWNFIGKNVGHAKRLVFGGGLEGEIVKKEMIKFNANNDRLMSILNKIGYTPLPPYIKPREGVTEPNLRQRYQTVYARDLGSVAAPTAGFHFTKELLEKILNKVFVTLHVGLGTFAPVRCEEIKNHVMHEEFFSISSSAKHKVLSAKERKNRIIAVGTTSVRVLESDWTRNQTNIFIYPGYKFKNVGAMITNFHLPKSTLLMLVCAFAGMDLIMKVYKEAVKEKYRFFSFGDAMLIV